MIMKKLLNNKITLIFNITMSNNKNNLLKLIFSFKIIQQSRLKSVKI